MTTLFDIGDKISFSVKGTVKAYSKDKNGDCYTIEIDPIYPHMRELCVYMETEGLLLGNAKKERG